MSCPSDNTQAVEQSGFWSEGSIHWDAHRVGWAIAGGSALLVRAISLSLAQETIAFLSLTRSQTVIISAITVLHHCRYAAVLRLTSYEGAHIP
jgi:hypothetical protein